MKKIIAEDKFGWPIEVLAEAEGGQAAISVADSSVDAGSLEEMATSRSTIKKYQALLDKPVWEKQEVLGVAHQLSALHRGGSRRDSMDEELKYILHDLLSYFEDDKKTKDISADQTAQGIKWLANTVLNKQGQMRNTKVVQDAGFEEEEAEVIRDFKKFELVGFKDIGNGTYAPMYAVISNAGKRFVYFVSGGWGGASIRVATDVSGENPHG
jgi:hypothetical protein